MANQVFGSYFNPSPVGVEKAIEQTVEDMFNFLVYKGFINLEEFKEFKENSKLIKNID